MLPLESLFRELNDRGGRYIVVGGLAVVLHGHLRATGDVDLLVDFEAGQVARTLAALEGAGFIPYVPVPASDFADPAKRAAWVRDKGMLVFSLRPTSGVPMVDLFLEHPISFDQLWDRSLVVMVRGVPVRIASIDDLITLKRQAGRPEDLTDAEATQPSGLPPDREALLRTTLALTVDERLAWLEQMMAIAIHAGALPKPVPDQLAGARRAE
jgi:Nucleotidyltransferase of unknown function (DUF6036)